MRDSERPLETRLSPKARHRAAPQPPSWNGPSGVAPHVLIELRLPVDSDPSIRGRSPAAAAFPPLRSSLSSTLRDLVRPVAHNRLPRCALQAFVPPHEASAPAIQDPPAPAATSPSPPGRGRSPLPPDRGAPHPFQQRPTIPQQMLRKPHRGRYQAVREAPRVQECAAEFPPA